MQKQKIEPLYLTVHSDYQSVFCGIFRGSTCLAHVQEPKLTASKNLMLLVASLLEGQQINWSEISFIGVNQGPSPFTTLRVVITTANGLLFAQRIPLIGVDGLRAFLTEFPAPSETSTIALLNAFNNDVYFALQKPDGTTEIGCEFYGTFLNRVAHGHQAAHVRFIGNGTALYREQILNLFPNAQIPEPLPETACLKTVAQCALQQYLAGRESTDPLLPLYLKTLHYKAST